MPPISRAALQRGIINNAETTADAEKIEVVFLSQFSEQWQDFRHCQLEGFYFGQLRTDVHLEAAQPQVFQLARACVDLFDVFESNAKFILVSARGDLRVRASSHVWVYPDSHGSDLLEPRRHAIDAEQFRLALSV